jgi:hypothetical protein
VIDVEFSTPRDRGVLIPKRERMISAAYHVRVDCTSVNSEGGGS